MQQAPLLTDVDMYLCALTDLFSTAAINPSFYSQIHTLYKDGVRSSQGSQISCMASEESTSSQAPTDVCFSLSLVFWSVTPDSTEN